MTETQELTAPDGMEGDALGDAVAMSGDTVAAGAPLHSTATNMFQGAVYMFRPAPPASASSTTATPDDDGPVGATTATTTAAGQALDFGRQAVGVGVAGARQPSRHAPRRHDVLVHAERTGHRNAGIHAPDGRPPRLAGAAVAATRANAHRALHPHHRRGQPEAEGEGGHDACDSVGGSPGAQAAPRRQYAVAIKATDPSGRSAIARPLRFTIAR
jgi:hypothetical protein